VSVAQSGSAWLAWRAEGPREAVADPEPILLIMGLGGSSHMWWRLLPHLAARHRAIVFDNRGTGDSDGAGGRLTMAELVADALAVLDAAGEERAHVIGVSMGGMVAQHLALDHRDRVRSLVLGCTTAGGNREPSPGAGRLLATAALRPLLGPRRTFPLVAPALYAERTRRERPERIAEDLRRRVEHAAPAWTTYAQLGAVAGHDTRARLPELAGLETLVLHGAEDALVPAARGRELASRIPGARLVLLPSCGHMLTTDDEEGTANAVLGHLERAAARSPQPA
jgi:pimeloyl-ACP methyl ester carboxylesterase